MMVTKLNKNVIDDDDDDDDFGYHYRDSMIAQFKPDLYHKSLSHQDQDKRDDGLKEETICGLILFLLREYQYQKMFMNMIITILEQVFSFE